LYLSTIPAGAAQEPAPIDLSKLDMEDLMNVKVTSVSKREQSLARTAAAVFVINREDMRRSGATNIPDLLRMAPGVDVEQIDANAWAISVRGFNSRYSNKVLVLIDGRTVYTPSFSGVFWRSTESLYYTARLPGGRIPGHARLDLRLARHFGESAEISLGQNLLRPRSTEYGDSFAIIGTQALRSVFAQIRWRF
jgi:hypothetical protein